MTYVPTTWEDETPESTPVKYRIKDSDGNIVEDNATIEVVTSITPGTPLNATNMNKMEGGIEDAHDLVATAQAAADAAQTDADKGVLVYGWRDNSYTLYVNGNETLTTSHKVYFPIPNLPEYENGAELIGVRGYAPGASSSGGIAIPLKKYVKATETWQTDLMTVGLTIDVNEIYSVDSAVQPVINSARKNFAIGDMVLAEISSQGTGVTHCQVEIILRPIEA